MAGELIAVELLQPGSPDQVVCGQYWLLSIVPALNHRHHHVWIQQFRDSLHLPQPDNLAGPLDLHVR